MKLRVLVFLFLLSIGALPSWAQVDRATLTGTIHDPSGGVVGGVTLTVTYPATGLARTVTSNETGTFFITGLPVGDATLQAEMNGFRPVRTDTSLSVGETKTINIAFQLASVSSAVEVLAEADLVKNTAEYGAVLQNSQISALPINGRNWGNLMALVPGAVDTGAGNGSSVRFFGRGGDDNNFRIDGVDATSVRNQGQSKSRLLLSTDAISEFRVSSSLYTAESGGSPGGQVEIVSKGGSNALRGSLFEYFRNSDLDARSPFDGKTVPLFHLNQLGATLGGPIHRDRTFFFGSYEGLIQRQGRTQIGFVPSAAYRAGVSPTLKSIVDFYPEGQTAVNANVMQWNGIGTATQDEHVGLVRVDHRLTDKVSGYVRVSKNSTDIFTPNTALPIGTRNLDAPTSGLVELLFLISPRTTNELRVGANYSEPLNSKADGGSNIAITVPSLSSIPAGTFRKAFGTTESLIDQFSTLRGAHALKVGIEFRNIQLIIHDGPNAQAGTLAYASLADFQANKLNTAEYSSELPTKQMRKLQYFTYAQDEWKIKPNLTANFGLRYEFYGVFREIHDRYISFDFDECQGYCPAGTPFARPDRNNFAPRVSFAWSPGFLHDNTVVRGGGGLYYGDAQLGDQYAPANNDTQRFTLSQATTPGLSFPIDSYLSPGLAAATAPRSIPLNKRNQVSQQWGLSIQQALGSRLSLTVGYNGQQNYHVFSRTFKNLIDPTTGKRPLPNFDQIDVRGEEGVSSFHGMVTTVQLKNWHGLTATGTYMLSHALNDGSSGGGGADGSGAQNVLCRSCEKANSSIDARHVFTSSFGYQLPFSRNHWLFGGWNWSGIATARTGLPVNVTVTRAATQVLDGNVLAAQRPDLVPGVPLYLDFASTGRWLNPAAFAVPAKGTWGNLGRNAVRAPGLYQFDTAVSKKVRITENTGVEVGIQAFNLFNHPLFGAPSANISSTANFGRITSIVNSSPVGTGTPRQLQLLMRVSF